MTIVRWLPILLGVVLATSVAADQGRAGGPVGHAAVDPRTPVPLTPMMAEHQKQNMRDHLAAVQEIVAALAADDLAAAAKSASRIGSSERMTQMCEHMGAGAPGFTEMALGFHRTADTIADAARRGDAKATTRALAETLATCVGCHAVYRQEVVGDAEWSRIVGERAPHAKP
jgi:cytochrome c556